jgi:biotin transport system substrate-specific component
MTPVVSLASAPAFPAPTLSAALWPRHDIARNALLALAGSALLALSAKMQIPFWPVPMTMQTYVVLVLAMAYGWRLGGATMLLYLAEGALGLPVFAGTPEKGVGLAYMMGPTGGYLAGFVLATIVAGMLAERGWDRSWLRTGAVMLVGHAVVFAAGVAWLATLIGFDQAVALGFTPFIAATVAKIALGLVTMPLAWLAVSPRPPR